MIYSPEGQHNMQSSLRFEDYAPPPFVLTLASDRLTLKDYHRVVYEVLVNN